MSKRAKLPKFSDIDVSKIKDELQVRLSDNRQEIKTLLEQNHFTWDSLVAPLEAMEDRLHQYWSIISHLNGVMNSAELREAYNECLPILTEYGTEISHNVALYNAYKAISESPEYAQLTKAQRKVIDNTLRDFKLAGVALEPAAKKQFAELAKRLSQLSAKFEENLLDATQAWTKHITDASELAGLPPHALAMVQSRAQVEGLEGWLLTLDMPSYIATVTHADSRALREEVYQAYVTRASDQGPNKGQWDNTKLIQEILDLRLQLANLLGFANYAEESLATKMVNSSAEVLGFLNELAQASLPKAREEFAELSTFAEKKLGLEKLAAWDIAYVSEKMREARYAISQEQLRAYFPEEKVITGLFDIVNKLFGITIEPLSDVDVWHDDVRCYALYDKNKVLRSYFYLDLYARANKRGGAWMDECRGRRLLANHQLQYPIAFITCNLTPPVTDKPALFTHQEVVTLFHEFGHALQHMLTTVNYLDVSGINGIPWDAVEVASQFLENWAWQEESIQYIAEHYQTHEPLSVELFQKMQRAKNFQAAMLMLRQLEFGLFDFELHVEFDPQQPQQVQKILNQVRGKVALLPVPEFNRFQNGFSHIFAGGYAAGYYSYKWAEVMASDAFELFLQNGVFDQQTADKFLTCFLEPGGSEDVETLFERFRGRKPDVSALLQQSGIEEHNDGTAGSIEKNCR